MFPTPCRLTDCKYVFDGREVLQRKGGEDVDIHGKTELHGPVVSSANGGPLIRFYAIRRSSAGEQEK